MSEKHTEKKRAEKGNPTEEVEVFALIVKKREKEKEEEEEEE